MPLIPATGRLRQEGTVCPTCAIFNENFPNERWKEKVDGEGLEGANGEDTKSKDYAKRSELGRGGTGLHSPHCCEVINLAALLKPSATTGHKGA